MIGDIHSNSLENFWIQHHQVLKIIMYKACNTVIRYDDCFDSEANEIIKVVCISVEKDNTVTR